MIFFYYKKFILHTFFLILNHFIFLYTHEKYFILFIVRAVTCFFNTILIIYEHYLLVPFTPCTLLEIYFIIIILRRLVLFLNI